jgi:putative transposase
VRLRLSRPLDKALIRSATLARDGDRWFMSFCVDDGQSAPEVHAHPGTAVGVDRGVMVAIAISDSKLRERALLIAGEHRRAVRLQHMLSRSATHSRNRAKTRTALGKIRARERHRRRDFCGQVADELAPSMR